MPYLTIETNTIIDQRASDTLLKSTSQFVSTLLGKPEKYVMIRIQPNSNLLFGGTNQPMAYVELKSINLPEDKTTEYSSQLCRYISKQFTIDKSRIYIEFSNAQRNMFGWNGGTF